MRASFCADLFVVVVSLYMLNTFFKSNLGQKAATKGSILNAVIAQFKFLSRLNISQKTHTQATHHFYKILMNKNYFHFG